MAYSMEGGLKTVSNLLNRLAKWLLLLAIIWLCWNIARIVWLVLAPPQAPNLPLTELQRQSVSTTNNGAMLAIFDEERPKPKVTPRATPNVDLKGVMLATPASLSAAMLDVDGTIASYRIGESIGNSGYKVSDVTWDKVMITDDSGQDVALNMPERMSLDQGLNFTGSKKGSSNKSSNLPTPTQSDTITSSNQEQDIDDYDVDEDRASVARATGNTSTGNNNPTRRNNNSPEAQIDRAIDELKQNPASYLSSMGVMATGDGYQVTDAMPAKIKNRLGLESGDRVISVNGRNVGGNPAGDADLLSQVKQSGEAQIQVQRGEQVITIRQQF